MKKFSSVIKNLHLLRKEWYGIIVKKARSHISHSPPPLFASDFRFNPASRSFPPCRSA